MPNAFDIEIDAAVQVADAQHGVQIAAHVLSPLSDSVRLGSSPSRNSPAASAAATARALGKDGASGLKGNPRSPAAAAPRTVSGPIVGRSARRSCPGLTSFTSTPPGPGRASAGAARQHRVGALGRLDRQHDALLHHAALPDIHGAQRARHRDAALDVGHRHAHRARPATAARAGPTASLQNVVRAEHAETLLGEHPHHGGQQPIVAGEGGATDARQDARALGIGPQAEQRRPPHRPHQNEIACNRAHATQQ